LTHCCLSVFKTSPSHISPRTYERKANVLLDISMSSKWKRLLTLVTRETYHNCLGNICGPGNENIFISDNNVNNLLKCLPIYFPNGPFAAASLGGAITVRFFTRVERVQVWRRGSLSLNFLITIGTGKWLKSGGKNLNCWKGDRALSVRKSQCIFSRAYPGLILEGAKWKNDFRRGTKSHFFAQKYHFFFKLIFFFRKICPSWRGSCPSLCTPLTSAYVC